MQRAGAHCRLPRRRRFLQYRGAYATETHPLVDASVTAAMRHAIKLVRAPRLRRKRSECAPCAPRGGF